MVWKNIFFSRVDLQPFRYALNTLLFPFLPNPAQTTLHCLKLRILIDKIPVTNSESYKLIRKRQTCSLRRENFGNNYEVLNSLQQIPFCLSTNASLDHLFHGFPQAQKIYKENKQLFFPFLQKMLSYSKYASLIFSFTLKSNYRFSTTSFPTCGN